MRRSAWSLVRKTVAVAWILFCVYVAQNLPATAGQRIVTAGTEIFSHVVHVFQDAGQSPSSVAARAGR